MVGNDWDIVLRDEYKKDYYKNMVKFLNKEYNEKVIFPLKSNIFKAFSVCGYNDVKVVILGQDPYHGDNEAHGLSFSVREGVAMPPSLRNIFKELESRIKKRPSVSQRWPFSCMKNIIRKECPQI